MSIYIYGIIQEKNHVFILERYLTKKESYMKAHKSSPIFLNFREKLQEMQVSDYITGCILYILISYLTYLRRHTCFFSGQLV